MQQCLYHDAFVDVAVMIFHVANSWQEGKDKDIIKLYACCFEEVPRNITDPQAIPCTLLSRMPC